MFILRSITPDGMEQNVTLGEFYSYIDKNAKSFSHYVGEDEPTAIGVVLDFESNEFTIHSQNRSFIMTETGQTFKRL